MTVDKPSCTCCGGSAAPAAMAACPACGEAGKRVQSATLKALLPPGLAATLGEEPWRFCESPACAVVYFDPESRRTFPKSQVTVRVGIKETAAPRPLCYCFGHSLESLQAEWEATGRMDSVAAVRAAVKEGHCRCDQANPSGACCLGDLLKAAQQIASAPRPGRV
jgi:hypothetical protein